MLASTRTPRRSYLLAVIFLLLTIGIVGVGYLYHRHHREQMKNQKTDELLAIADLKTNQIVRWRNERMADASLIRTSPSISLHLQKMLENATARHERKVVQEWMTTIKKHFAYEAVYLFDRRGSVWMEVLTHAESLCNYTRQLVPKAIAGKKPIFSDLQRDERTGDIHLDLLIPLVMSRNDDSTAIGLLLLRMYPSEFLFPFIQTWPTPSRTAETILIRREGDDLVYLNELRHRKNTALSLRLPISGERLPAAMAARGVEGVVEGIDYRGIPVVAAIRQIPDSPWFLIAKVDADEIYAPISERAWWTAILAGLLIIAAGANVGFIFRHQRARFYRAQYEAELERKAIVEHLDYFTKYANDIILLIDEDGKVVEANDRALTSYGYAREELLGLTVDKLRESKGGVDIKSLLKEVELQDGLLYETTHQRKDGNSFFVEISARVIMIEGRKFYQKIIRDITERKTAEVEIRTGRELLNEILETLPDTVWSCGPDGRFLFLSPVTEQIYGRPVEELLQNPFFWLTTVHPDDRDEVERHTQILFTTGSKDLTYRIVRPDGSLVWLHDRAHIIKNQKNEIVRIIGIGTDVTERILTEEVLWHSEKNTGTFLSLHLWGYIRLLRMGGSSQPTQLLRGFSVTTVWQTFSS